MIASCERKKWYISHNYMDHLGTNDMGSSDSATHQIAHLTQNGDVTIRYVMKLLVPNAPHGFLQTFTPKFISMAI